MKKIIYAVMLLLGLNIMSSCTGLLLANEFNIGKISDRVEEITDNSAVIRGSIDWKNSEYQPQNCRIYINYQPSETPIDYFTDSENIVQEINEDLKFEFRLTNLKPNSTYYYCVHITSGAMGGADGKMNSFKTK